MGYTQVWDLPRAGPLRIANRLRWATLSMFADMIDAMLRIANRLRWATLAAVLAIMLAPLRIANRLRWATLQVAEGPR